MAYVSNAWKQTKRGGPKNDSPITAGVGKLPAQTVTNKSELKELGERMGWKVRPLTEKEIKGGMSGQELIWHETFSPSEVEKALSWSAIGKHNDDAKKQWAAKRIWEDRATPEETQAAINEVAKFTSTYPQFRGADVENRKKLLDYLKQRNETVTFQNLVTAFEALALEGSISLSPAAIAAGSETNISGQDLRRHHSFHLLLQPQRRASDVDRMSADDFKAAAQATHPELRDQRVSPIVAAKNAKAEATAQHFHQAAEHTNNASVVTLVDYPDQPHGVPPESEKFSFKAKVRSMSATELAERCQLDPAFKKSLDEM